MLLWWAATWERCPFLPVWLSAMAGWLWLNRSRAPKLSSWGIDRERDNSLFAFCLLRHQNIEPARALAWPFGFAGIAPLRSAAVYGMMCHVLQREFKPHSRLIAAATLILIAAVGFSVVWSREQYFTEVFVEFVAGTLVLFVGFYWLEGYGLAPKPGPQQVVQP